ncbi:hypothetical protein [Roseimicrobium sp. ORNL1]|uniref:hypothetical protein n=1 Tax=Roseimicrobium sp. ORNL1 TaxID=2711231 RepID=UPI0013E0EE8C|nr:hypothetical protein [Roseimicrobium sp. ORNL1]QIF05759.1 hypothetical protein G5S37_31105 [Roseimicrobium sp. ORNL1]
MTHTAPMQSGTTPTPDGKDPASPKSLPSPDGANKKTVRPRKRRKIKIQPRRDKTVWEAAPNGIDHAILLVGLGIFVSLVLFAIFRVMMASHQ